MCTRILSDGITHDHLQLFRNTLMAGRTMPYIDIKLYVLLRFSLELQKVPRAHSALLRLALTLSVPQLPASPMVQV